MMARHKEGEGKPAVVCNKRRQAAEQKSMRGEAGNRHRADGLPVPGVLQAKLAIGKANDSFEQEADRVANDVMRMPHNTDMASVHTASDRMVQRKCACGGRCDDCKKKRLSLKRRDASSHDSTEVPA